MCYNHHGTLRYVYIHDIRSIDFEAAGGTYSRDCIAQKKAGSCWRGENAGRPDDDATQPSIVARLS